MFVYLIQGCLINGQCLPDDTKHPTIACKKCDFSQNRLDWSEVVSLAEIYHILPLQNITMQKDIKYNFWYYCTLLIDWSCYCALWPCRSILLLWVKHGT